MQNVRSLDAARVRPTVASTGPSALQPDAALWTADGASAALERGTLVIRSPSGEAVVRYDAQAGLQVIAPDGDLTLAAPKGRVVVQAGTEVVLEASRLTLRAAELTQLVGRWELRAERIVESAKDVYRDVAELLQQRAGRARTLVRGVSQLVAGRTEIVSDEDTVVDGKRVLLG
jgi:hypothetical protein